MGTNQEEVQEITVLTEEQINQLPDTVKKNVVFLTEEARPKELMKLNPLATELLNLRDKVSKLELKRDDKNNITKESIDAYKELKAEQRTFNGKLTATAKILQKPYQDINKGFLEIKKTFKEESDKVKDEAEKIFADYETEKAKKAAEKQAKKDAEMNAKIEAANEQTAEITTTMKKSNAINAIKYDRIKDGISSLVTKSILDANEQALFRLKAQLAQHTIESVSEGVENKDLLTPEDLESLQKILDEAKQDGIRLIDDKIDQYENNRQAMIKENAPGPVPPPPVGDGYMSGVENPEQAFSNSSDIEQSFSHEALPVNLRWKTNGEFVDKIKSMVTALEFAVDMRLKEFKDPSILELKNRFNQFNS